ncbi:unannotated protein [freshwater metagenome]|uniref:Unannotated protein n=1 Tax=freshwater metagenome TaxID=449393 RepID=A0A6J6A236_9ZZZZ|nr:DUF805 domain-containing protein [Actinomycetota bacterium]MSX12619.1 DUF805 domain-containing protein [Actinomycetota bacterium]
MGFGEAVSTCFKKSVVWEGRASRAEFWWFELGQALIIIAALIIDQIIGTMFIYIIAAIALILPSIAVLVRRLHDTDRTGWWYWIQLLPLIGLIVILVFTLTGGDQGDNKYGPNPYGSVAPPPPAV